MVLGPLSLHLVAGKWGYEKPGGFQNDLPRSLAAHYFEELSLVVAFVPFVLQLHWRRKDVPLFGFQAHAGVQCRG